MFRRIFFSAVIAGILGGSAITLVQHFTTTPIILHAETFESIGDDGEKHGTLKKGVVLISPAHAHGPHKDSAKLEAGNWAPDDGLESNVHIPRQHYYRRRVCIGSHCLFCTLEKTNKWPHGRSVGSRCICDRKFGARIRVAARGAGSKGGRFD